ncbi:MAG: 16S rRNA (guanine(966)-N(2))-methyltransferase RsmD [Oscillospiraceae bacterium]|nr:16S rRNA (guanine(966)-N(2))-methyltransferase RsmD [Oscillospiraceae bacterium]
MRVITGTARGAKLYVLEGRDVRPTAQRVKEAEFSAVQFYVPGARVLDLFAGSGQLGLEALSRGAGSAVFVDSNEDSIKVVRRNLEKTGLLAKAKIVRSDSFRYLSRTEELFDIVFIDPPYHMGLAKRALRRVSPNVSDAGFVLCETEANADMPETVGGILLKKRYKHGQTSLWLYRKEKSEFDENRGISGEF